MTFESAAAIVISTAIGSLIHKVWDRHDEKHGRGPGRWEPDSVKQIRAWRRRRQRSLLP